MLAGSARRAPHRLVLMLRLLDHFADDRFKLEQLQLRLGELFAPPAPYLSIRINRSRSSSTRILSSAYFSNAVSSGADPACRRSNPDSCKTRSAAYRCSQTPPPAAELPLVYVAWALPISFLSSSSYFNT